MAGCDQFEIEIERRLHGALGEAEDARLAAHLSTCARCRAFEASARLIEVGMRAAADEAVRGVDWAQVERAIGAWRRRSTVVLGTWTALAVVLAGQAWRHRGEAGPAEYASLVAGLFLAILGVRLVRDLARRRRVAAMARGPHLLEVLRTDLQERRRAIRLSLILFPLLTAFFGWQAFDPAAAGRRPLLAIAAGICVATGLAVWFVKRPKLDREQAALDGATRTPGA